MHESKHVLLKKGKMHPVKRPKPGDTEEDLLEEQKEFLEGLKANRVVPAAKVIKQPRRDFSSGPEDDKHQHEPRMEEDKEEQGDEDSKTPLEHPVEAVLFEVKEKPFDPLKLQAFGKSKGIPEILRVDGESAQTNETSTGTRKKSLFARAFDARKEERKKTAETQAVPNTHKNEVHATPTSEHNVDRRAVGDQIHPYLAGMTEEEILEEQRKLLERLDPKLVEFIKSGRHKSAISVQKDVGKAPETKMEIDEPRPGDQEMNPPFQMKEDDLPINPKLVENYPGMNKVELPKLEWTGVVKDGEMEGSVQGKSARFDFSGMLLPERSNDPSTFERALHNHGQEMERPGYTIEELLTLARSVNIQQRSIALETLGHIFAQAHIGLFDEILEQSIFSLTDYMDLIHTIRKGLDNVDSNSINSSLSCLASLLYPDLEEDCLDAVHLWPNVRPFPLLQTKPNKTKEDGSAEKELKDFEFLQLDLLDFLVNRSEILTRIEYIITTKSDLLSEKGVTSILKILIRLARHSPSEVMKHERVLKFITENYVSPNWILLRERDNSLKGVPLVHALKLVRVLVASSAQNATKLYNSYSIMPSVMSYLAYDQWRDQTHVQEVENLVLEAFKIWMGFLTFQIAIDEYLSLFPVLMQFLTFYGLATDLNSFDLHHSSHLFALLTHILCFGLRGEVNSQKVHSHWSLVKDTVTTIENHCIKTMKILSSSHLEGKYSLDLALLSLGKAMEFLFDAVKYRGDKDSMKRKLLPVIAEFSSSRVFLLLTANLKSHSSILSDSSDQSRYPPNYVSIDAVRWKGELNPVMRPNSPYHILKYLIMFTGSLTGATKIPNLMLVNSDTEKYLSAICKKSKDCVDYFIRFELSCVLEILNVLPADYKEKFTVAYNAVVHVPLCCPSLFQDMLKVALNTCCSRESDVRAVFKFYASYFVGDEVRTIEEEIMYRKSRKVKFDDGGHPGDGDPIVLFESWTKTMAESHWILHPLESIYKRVHSTPYYLEDNLPILEQETRGCLSFIHQCLQSHSDSILKSPQDIVTVYCRICRVFMLGSPNVYIDDMTIPKLKGILQILLNVSVLKTSTVPIFSNHKPSKSAAVSFFDFYTELVNEYFDNSYFNEVFASYLFLPLRSAEDSNVKTCFWGHQYLNCVKLTSDKIPVPVEYLTRHLEKDQKMLTMFTNLLKQGIITRNVNPFLYEILSAHLKQSAEFMTENLKLSFGSLCI